MCKFDIFLILEVQFILKVILSKSEFLTSFTFFHLSYRILLREALGLFLGRIYLSLDALFTHMRLFLFNIEVYNYLILNAERRKQLKQTDLKSWFVGSTLSGRRERRN